MSYRSKKNSSTQELQNRIGIPESGCRRPNAKRRMPPNGQAPPLTPVEPPIIITTQHERKSVRPQPKERLVPKSLSIHPEEVRSSGSLEFKPIPVNQYSRSLQDELDRFAR